MCKGFDCLDCPLFYSENCYYYGKDFMDYYKKVQQEKGLLSGKWSVSIETVDLNT
ncbi:MAG: hypothetical protein ACFE9M_06550 [Promethearchaeota archaeon]